MKLERLQESVLPFFVLLSGLLLALYAGLAAGSGKMGTVLMIVGAIVATALMLMTRERIWMLVPACAVLPFKVSALPLPFTIAQLGILFAFAVFLALKALKVVRLKPKTGIVEIWMIVNLIYLVSVFFRNPVGVDALGSDRVGGRPYFDIAVAVTGMWVLSHAIATPRNAFFLPLCVIATNGLHTLLNVIANHFPSMIGPLARVYSGISAAETLEAGPLDDGNRLTHFTGLGSSMFMAAISFWRPMTLINPFLVGRFLVLLISLLAVLLSGYRSTLIALMAFTLLSSYFRRGAREVMTICLLGFFSLAVLLLMQGTVFELPMTAQRALSFLPGKWDYSAKAEAQASTEWRMEMWKAMLTGNKYIANKWLGDGFGFTKVQLQIMAANSQKGTIADQHENLLINGNVHSGPITAIRYVGYVGLTLYLVFAGFVAVRSLRLIRRAQNTPFFPLALFFGMPALLHPFSFVLIFGAFDMDLPNTILNVGLQKMLENSLDSYDASQKVEASPAAQPLPQFRRPPQFAPAGRIA